MWRVGAVLVALALTGGCHRYVPVDVEDLAPRSDIRARVTAEQGERLQPLLMRERIQVVEARFLERQNGSLLIEVPVVNEWRGMHVETLHQRVDIPLSSILVLEHRQMDRGRTTVVVGAAGVALAALAFSQFRDTGSSERDPGSDPPAEVRIPLRLPISASLWR